MQAVKTAEEKIFVTNTGKKLLKNMYLTPLSCCDETAEVKIF